MFFSSLLPLFKSPLVVTTRKRSDLVQALPTTILVVAASNSGNVAEPSVQAYVTPKWPVLQLLELPPLLLRELLTITAILMTPHIPVQLLPPIPPPTKTPTSLWWVDITPPLLEHTMPPQPPTTKHHNLSDGKSTIKCFDYDLIELLYKY